MRLSARRVAKLEHTHASVLNRCRTCGGYDPMNPAMVITRDEQPLEHCHECGLALTEEGQPLPPHYKRIVLPDGGDGV